MYVVVIFNICKVMNFFEKNIIIDCDQINFTNDSNLLFITLGKVCKFYLNIKEQNHE